MSKKRTNHYCPIEDYGVIGDLHTAALVSKQGSIDFLCFPHFNSPTVFAALLDYAKGGKFQIAPSSNDGSYKQIYLPDTNILFTRFLSKDGVGEVSDFMPITDYGHAHDLIRRAKTIRGKLAYRMICAPRFDYGRAKHRIQRCEDCVLFISEGSDGTVLRLRSDVPIKIVNGDAVAEFTLGAGETAAFVLEEAREGEESPSVSKRYVPEAFKETATFWRSWSARSTYQGRWREMVTRSALTLKLLTSTRYGSMVAAPTFSLPESIGGGRNWDYRYTWIRDTSLALYAFMRLGYTEEAQAFMDWIQQRCEHKHADGSLQLMYGLDGETELHEMILDHWEGYRGSSPVRIGNAAFQQLQLDIYGELMDAVYLYNKYGEPIHDGLWRNLVGLIDWVCNNWHLKDQSIWEVRAGPQEFLYSRLMCWVAIDRGIRLATKRSFPAPINRWRDVRDQIYHDIFDNFWDADRKAFVQYKGSRNLDAACLVMPLMLFIGPTDPRWLSTLRAVEEELVNDSLVYRYCLDRGAEDGLQEDEGSFTMCSFWYIECLARSGDLDKARFNFEKVIGFANHLGLYAEELGPHGEHLGNFPQSFTHVGLISAAFELNRRLTVAEVRSRIT